MKRLICLYYQSQYRRASGGEWGYNNYIVENKLPPYFPSRMDSLFTKYVRAIFENPVNPLKVQALSLDGWYEEVAFFKTDGEYTWLRFTCTPEERDTADSVYVMADNKRIYPTKQEGDQWEYNIKGVRIVYIESKRPGENSRPFSEAIYRNRIGFYR